MRRSIRIWLPFVVMVCSLLQSTTTYANDVKLEDIINGHLDSIAKPDVRSKAQSRVVEGTAQFRVLTGGAGAQDGKAVFVSEGRKVQLNLKFVTSNYHGERFITDGNKVTVATATDNQSRSSLGELVHVQDAMMREGLLGGELTTAWPLLDVEGRKAKLTYEGLKNIDGKSLYDVRYKPKKGGDVEVHIYFDSDFHHVMTVYTMQFEARLVAGGQLSNLAIPELGSAGSQAAGSNGVQGTVGSDAAQASAQSQTRYRIEERFSDFQTVDGVTLPSHYVLHYTQEPQSGKTTVLNWEVATTRVLENVTLDPKNFAMK